ncbi:MAG: Sua5 YciO YrdC YwlC family protein [Campylobacterota bacterium]
MQGDFVYLVQTDTTAGFLSRDAGALNRAKQRIAGKSYITALAGNKDLPRIPQAHKNRVRRADKTTFIHPNGKSYRVIRGPHRDFVKRFGAIYSTSANKSGQDFDINYAKAYCDVIVEDTRGLRPRGASSLIRLSKTTLRRLR